MRSHDGAHIGVGGGTLSNALRAFVLVEGGTITGPAAEGLVERQGTTDRGGFFQLCGPSLEWLGDLTLGWCDHLSDGCTITLIVMKMLKGPPNDRRAEKGFAFAVPARDVTRWVARLACDVRVVEAYLVAGSYDFVVFGDDLNRSDFPHPVLSLSLLRSAMEP